MINTSVLRLYVALLPVVLILAACTRDKDLSGEVEKLNWPKDGNRPLDEWLNANVLAPYNIQIRYKWDRIRLGAAAQDVIPVNEDKVMPVVQSILEVFLRPYEAIAGQAFIKTYPPKEFFLAGSVRYNTNGTVQLGVAEGGRSVILYDLNDFDEANEEGFNTVLHTIHHEFGHILHQNKLIDPLYGTLSAGAYTSDWTSKSLQTALNAGFITPYSMVDANEDFVEVIATLLVEGQAYFDTLVARAGTNGARILRQKEELVVTYFLRKWNIDFRQLQQRVSAAISTVKPTDPNRYIGPGLTYTSLLTDSVQTGVGSWSRSFTQLFKRFDTAVRNFNTAFRPDNLRIYFDESGYMKMRTRTNNTGNGAVYYSDFLFSVSRDAGNLLRFTYIGPYTKSNNAFAESNAQVFESTTRQLINYFSNNLFYWEWPANATDRTKVKLVNNADVNDFVIGVLDNATN